MVPGHTRAFPVSSRCPTWRDLRRSGNKVSPVGAVMIKSACIAVAAFLFTLTPVMAAKPATVVATNPSDVPTRDAVIAKVNKAVEYYRQYGREKTIAELNRRDGAFAKGMDYVDLHDISGVC